MGAIGNGTTQYIASAGTISPLTSAYSWAFWYFPVANPAFGGAAKHPFSVVDGTEAHDFNFAWDHPSSAVYKSAVHREAGGTYIKAQHPGTPANNDGKWHHIAATYGSGTLKLYYDGIEVASIAASAMTNSVSPNITILSYKSGAAGFDDQKVTEFCLWSVALTAADVLTLSHGVAPSTVQNASVVQYTPLQADADTVTGIALTNHSATFNGTFIAGSTGGPAVGGSTTITQTTYGWIPSGGPAVGGSQMLTMAAYHWTPAGGAAVGGSETVTQVAYGWTPSGGVAVGGTFPTQTSYHYTPDGGILVTGDFRITMATPGNAVVIAAGRSESLSEK